MRKGLFRWKWVANKKERTVGVAFRFFGIDFSALLLGWINEWSLIDLRIPCNRGIYLQVLFALISIGWLRDDSIYED